MSPARRSDPASGSAHEFFVDLPFFHVEQLRYVVVELKVGKFKPEFAGQLGFSRYGVGFQGSLTGWITGKTAFKQYAGSGLSFNNNYAGLALGPDGTAYLAVTGGIVALRDG